MAEAIDVMSDATGDLLIKNGGFVHDDATLIHQRNLLLAAPGSYGQSPTIGVAVQDYLDDDISGLELKGRIQREFEADGMNIAKLGVDGYDFDIEAEYE